MASYAHAAVACSDDLVVAVFDTRYAQLVTDTVWWYDANKDALNSGLGTAGGQWMTFRLEHDIAYSRAVSTTVGTVSEACRAPIGGSRYWAKFAADEQPWLVYDYSMPLRWQPGHAKR